MNELAVIRQQMAEVERRAAELKTRSGRLAAEQEMTQIFAVLTAYGYRMPAGDARLTMTAWVEAFSEYIALYGFPILKKAVIHFATHDDRQYKDFPRPSDIIAAVRAVGGIDPTIAQARAEAKEREAEIIARWQDEHKDSRQRWAAENEDWIRIRRKK